MGKSIKSREHITKSREHIAESKEHIVKHIVQSRENIIKSKEHIVKSKERVVKYGEVMTPDWLVNELLDLVKEQSEQIDARFLDPACGNGNFLAEILRRKLNTVERLHGQDQHAFEKHMVWAVSSLYGIDILEDNVTECRSRLFDLANERYMGLFGDKTTEACRNALRYILMTNIVWGDTLTSTTMGQDQTSIVFPEWTFEAGSDNVRRKDFAFASLTRIPDDRELIAEYSATHFMKIGESL